MGSENLLILVIQSLGEPLRKEEYPRLEEKLDLFKTETLQTNIISRHSCQFFPLSSIFPFTIFNVAWWGGFWTVRASSHVASFSVSGLRLTPPCLRNLQVDSYLGVKEKGLSHSLFLQLEHICNRTCESGLGLRATIIIVGPRLSRARAHSTPQLNLVHPCVRWCRAWHRYHWWDGKIWQFAKCLWPSKALYLFSIISIIFFSFILIR